MNRQTVEVTGLTVYPVKSMKGVGLDNAVLTPLGLEHDRRFMVVRADGSFVTQRDTPLMALVQTAFEPGGLMLSREGYGQVYVPFDNHEGEHIRTRVWKDECETTDQGEIVSRWLTETLESNVDLHLVAMARDFVRPQGKPDQLGADTRTLFADAAPFLVANEESLARLNGELEVRGHESVPMNRFRPNIVLRGQQAFGEHDECELAGDGYALRLCYPCERCIVTTIDQFTARKHPGWEPYRTLSEINPMPGRENAPAFGQNAALAGGEGHTVRVGDLLTVEGV
jgi:uncharacterized protein YcbX